MAFGLCSFLGSKKTKNVRRKIKIPLTHLTPPKFWTD